MDPLIDQSYFSNIKKSQNIPSINTKSNPKSNLKPKSKPYSKTDFKLYRKEIYSLTKDLLNKKNGDDDITYYFDEFIYHAIEYLKFKEKESQIQETYTDLDMSAKSSHTFNTPQNTLLDKVEESNMLMYKDYNLKTISMDNFVKKKTLNTVQQIHLPTQKIIKHKTLEPNKKNVMKEQPLIEKQVTQETTKEKIEKNNEKNNEKNIEKKKNTKKDEKKRQKKKTMKIDV